MISFVYTLIRHASHCLVGALRNEWTQWVRWKQKIISKYGTIRAPQQCTTNRNEKWSGASFFHHTSGQFRCSNWCWLPSQHLLRSQLLHLNSINCNCTYIRVHYLNLSFSSRWLRSMLSVIHPRQRVSRLLDCRIVVEFPGQRNRKK